MTDILITNATIVTMDRERRVIDGGAIAIAGDRIAEIGGAQELAARHANSHLGSLIAHKSV